MKMLHAVVTPAAADAVARFLDRMIPAHCPMNETADWAGVMSALYALGNDTDFIVTDPALVPDVAGASPINLYLIRSGDEVNNFDQFVWAASADDALAAWRNDYDDEEMQATDVLLIPHAPPASAAVVPWHAEGGVVSALPPIEERLAAKGATLSDRGQWCHADHGNQHRHETPAEYCARLPGGAA